MMSLNTAFKKVYGETLEPYGFKKVKGKYPYFARVIGDEIVHVITCTTRPCFDRGYKEYGIYGGVATVYREKIDFDIPITHNFNWFIGNLEVYERTDPRAGKINKFHLLYTYSYKENDEKSLLQSLRYSFKATQKYLLRALESVTDLRSCVDFMHTFAPNFSLYEDAREYEEGFMLFKVFSVEEHKKVREKWFEQSVKEWLKRIEDKKTNMTREEFDATHKKVLEDGMNKVIKLYESHMGNAEQHKKDIEELERRKKENLEILRKYGFDV